MLDVILQTDEVLFRLFNTSLANPVFDVIMPVITNERWWYLPYALLFGWLLWKGGRGGRICAALLVLGVVIGDQFNSAVLKEWVGRIRPCHALEGVRLVGVSCGSGKSFPSSHAVNNFTAAVLISQFFPKARIICFVIGSAVAFSRVYVGVHYPLDVVAGAAEGVVIAVGLLALQRLAAKKNPVFSDKPQTIRTKIGTTL